MCKHLPAFTLDVLIQTFHVQYCLLTTERKLSRLLELSLGYNANLPCPPFTLYGLGFVRRLLLVLLHATKIDIISLIVVETVIVLPTTHTKMIL